MTLWINGDWITGQGERRRKTNPVSAEILWQGNDANAAQVAEACQAARAAFPRWARQPFTARQAIVEKFAACWRRIKPISRRSSRVKPVNRAGRRQRK
ncbi:succinylglutamic semialdehyde dehydrogenase [Salmonella enterica subsp. enterica]|nr:succinylglutamic semialdehyde dehydrogenase [Salmonella enterica subsp. enterica]